MESRQMKKRKLLIMLAMVCFAVVLYLFGGIGISVIVINDDTLADLKSQYPDHDILVAGLAQTTGSSWEIVYPETEQSTGDVVLDFPFDPLALKMNRDWPLGSMHDKKFVIMATKSNKTIKPFFMGGQEFKLIKAEKIFIDSVPYGEDVRDLKIKDMQATGIITALIGIFVPLMRYSY
jgi:hypothetical protein